MNAFSPKTLAGRWGCSDQHVRNLITRGELPAFRCGKLIRITGQAPGFAYVYNADAFRRWLDGASPGTAANTNRQPPAPAAKTDWSTRMATAAANVAGEF